MKKKKMYASVFVPTNHRDVIVLLLKNCMENFGYMVLIVSTFKLQSLFKNTKKITFVRQMSRKLYYYYFNGTVHG